MNRVHCILFLTLYLFSCSTQVRVKDVAGSVAVAGFEHSDITEYPGSCFLHGVSEYARAASDAALQARLTETLDRFRDGDLAGHGSLISYCIGGTAMAEQALWGNTSYSESVLSIADSMFRAQPRNSDGLMIPAWDRNNIRPDGVFIDLVFGVTPFFLYAGLLADKEEWVDYAAWTALRTYGILRDPETGLVHQARSVLRLGEGEISRDCWSRGNGWGSIALAALMRDLPEDNQYFGQVRDLAEDYFKAVLRYQDADGLWHQEMTFPDCWQETSGSALLLYGIGTAIDCGILPESAKESFARGIEGLLQYIDKEGNIAGTCGGCLAVGDSSKEIYASQVPYWNERHAFGPVMLALSVAEKMGIHRFNAVLGGKTASLKPACIVRHVEARKDDIAWENDWFAYRIYSQKSPTNKISSGIDYWAKKVDYPVLDKWYAANADGGSYHEDKGEGYDFYVVGKHRGVGGSGVFLGDSLYVSGPYEKWEIKDEGPGHAAFTVTYPPFKAGEDTISQESTFSFVLGSPFTCVETTLTSERGGDLTLAIGLTAFGNEIISKETNGVLLMSEVLSGKVKLHSILITDPSGKARRADVGDDRLLLLDVHSGETVRYYFSAFSDLTNRAGKWHKLVSTTTWKEIENYHHYD